jgi:hypothetical protein
VLDLVVQVSAFGSAGSVAVVCFGLFTKFGGARAALATLIAGMGSYLVGLAVDSSLPFITSLAASLTMYVAVGAYERAVSGGQTPTLT